jgi:hypothetical protein
MSSVMRSLKQTPSNFFWSHDAYIYTLDYLKAWFRGEGDSNYSGPVPTYTGNFILFDTEENFDNATRELLDVDNENYSYFAEGYTTHRDMGKTIYIGVVGGESQMLTMSLVKVQSNSTLANIGKTGYGLSAMNLPATIAEEWEDSNDVEVNLIRGGV